MVSVRHMPWHRAEEQREHYLNSSKCIGPDGLDFGLEKRPMYTDISELMEAVF